MTWLKPRLSLISLHTIAGRMSCACTLKVKILINNRYSIQRNTNLSWKKDENLEISLGVLKLCLALSEIQRIFKYKSYLIIYLII